MSDEMEKEEPQQRYRQDWHEVQVEGYFNSTWFSWMNEWKITPLPNGNTLLTGPVIDQPALHGIFAQIRDMNIKIISLKKLNNE